MAARTQCAERNQTRGPAGQRIFLVTSFFLITVRSEHRTRRKGVLTGSRAVTEN